MKKSEIISFILSAVSEETGVELKIILSQDKRREVVDARHIAINLLHKYGIYNSHIASIFNTTIRNIYHALSFFDTRISFSPPMKNDYERIRKKVGYTCEITAKQ